MADDKLPKGMRVVLTSLSALTRQKWLGLVVAEGLAADDLADLTAAMYDHVDGDAYVQDELFWERGEGCNSIFLKPSEAVESPFAKSHVAYKDEDGAVVVADLPAGESPVTYIRQLKATGGDPKKLARIRKARKLFEAVEGLDGCVVTDSSRLAEAVAGKFGVPPEAVYDGYAAGCPEEVENVYWVSAAKYVGWPRFDVTLKGFRRVFASPVEGEEFPEGARERADDLVKWVVAPSHAVLAKWIADHGLTPFVESMEELADRGDIGGPADGLDLVIDADGRIVGGSPEAPERWIEQAREFGRFLETHNIVPVFANRYHCHNCGSRWVDEWAGQPDDECPKCKKPHSPYESREVCGFVESR